jgi:hypothetical protein
MSKRDKFGFIKDSDRERDFLNPVARVERRRATGFEKRAGKTIASDGLVSRGGFRRIVPEEGQDPFALDQQIEMLVEMAKGDPRQWRNIKSHLAKGDPSQWRHIKSHVNEARHEQIEKNSKV